jgi:triacylglycerol lipase
VVPLLVALLAAVLAAPAGTTEDGPPLSATAESLAASLSCPSSSGPRPESVLLVHGTASNSTESWSWNYLRALPELGFVVCTVDLPGRSLGDIQVATEYVVHAVREMATRFGRPVDLIGHSQGSLEARWALRWWPGLRLLVDDDVSLGGPNHGTSDADWYCQQRRSCPPAVQQQRTDSRFLAALNAGDETPGSVSYTTVASRDDEIVRPVQSPALVGAVNIVVQDLCPGRPVHHAGLLHDAATFAVVLDALTRPGPADPGALDPAVCTAPWMPGVVEPFTGNAIFYGNAAAALFGYPDNVDAEPSVASYAGGR